MLGDPTYSASLALLLALNMFNPAHDPNMIWDARTSGMLIVIFKSGMQSHKLSSQKPCPKKG